MPVVTSRATRAVIESYTSDRLPPAYVAGILRAREPVTAGIGAATELAELMLGIPA